MLNVLKYSFLNFSKYTLFLCHLIFSLLLVLVFLPTIIYFNFIDVINALFLVFVSYFLINVGFRV